MTSGAVTSVIHSELSIFAGAITTVLFLLYGDVWLADLSRGGWFLFVFSWLFVVMLWLAFNVVRPLQYTPGHGSPGAVLYLHYSHL